MNDREICMERERKAKVLLNEREKPNLTQAQIAQKYGMSVKEVSMVFQEYSYHHTIRSTGSIERGGNGRPVNALIDDEKLSFLDKYSF